MALVPEEIKNQLKEPLGRIGDPGELRTLSRMFRIISVGDISTLHCLEEGVVPFIAVFDFVYMRKPLDERRRKKLMMAFPKFVRVSNPPGTISQELVSLASSLIEKGGAIKVDGEEDLTALVFIALADSRTAIIYGQPDAGLVFVEPNEETKNKAKAILKELNLG